MQRTSWVAAAAVLTMLAGCAPKAEDAAGADQRMAAEAASAKTAIEASNQQFMGHFNAGHGDSLATLYAENGRMMAPNMPAAVGRAAIAGSMAGMAGMSPKLELTTTSVMANGPMAIEAGTYRITVTPPGAKAPIVDTGKYLVHWHKVGDKWMMVDDIWNSDMPAMPMEMPKQ